MDAKVGERLAAREPEVVNREVLARGRPPPTPLCVGGYSDQIREGGERDQSMDGGRHGLTWVDSRAATIATRRSIRQPRQADRWLTFLDRRFRISSRQKRDIHRIKPISIVAPMITNPNAARDPLL